MFYSDRKLHRVATGLLVPSHHNRRRCQMKTYTDLHHLRLVGKAWEIRATLRRLSNKPITLQEWLARLDRAVQR
ncbi:Z-ring formation inhibitor MciZ [Brevibacillus humidisoli]|uniref:Z-ring formation inhibitor MciZ n=1 Tax=Brevibacillus humidisoli TaxID=2895522 RepID=UPI0030B9E6DF